MDIGEDLRGAEVATGFEGFFRAHFVAVARAAALVVGDFSTGEEIGQEAFARLYARWGSMQSEDHARNFAYKVALNLFASVDRGLMFWFNWKKFAGSYPRARRSCGPPRR